MQLQILQRQRHLRAHTGEQRHIAVDQPLEIEDVELPDTRLVRLFAEQKEMIKRGEL